MSVPLVRAARRALQGACHRALHRSRGAAVVLALLAVAGAAGACGDAVPVEPVPELPPEPSGPSTLPRLEQRQLDLPLVADGFDAPLYLTAPAGDPRLFVVERAGRIRVLADGVVRVAPFLDLRDLVSSEGPERGMLSMAFHPRYARNGRVYVAYTDIGGNIVVARYEADVHAPDRADPGSERVVLRIPHLGQSHYGGQLAFGPDGMLYLSTGDGGDNGSPGGPGADARRLGSLLGKVLRLDVDGAEPYAIPRDNPFRGVAGAHPEIWAIGLRNPWRLSFDDETGLLYVADVGESAFEEVNVVRPAPRGFDFGWNATEGAACLPADAACSTAGIVLPRLAYGHGPPCTSITGGFVYRGDEAPEHTGRYFFADYCQGWIRSMRYADGEVAEYVQWTDARVGAIQSFGRDAAGELYVLLAAGAIHRIGHAR